MLHLRHHLVLASHPDAAEMQVRLRLVPGELPGQSLRRAALSCSANPRIASHVERSGARVDTFGLGPSPGEVEVLVEADVRTEGPPEVTRVEAVELTQVRGPVADDADDLDHAVHGLRVDGVPARVLLAHRGDGEVRASAELFLERAVDDTWRAETLSGDAVTTPLLRIATGLDVASVVAIRLVQHAAEPPEVRSVASVIAVG